MIPIKQTILHDPENGIHGNCLSAVLASILHLPIEEIPVFSSAIWQHDLNQWLKQYGLAYVLITGFDEYCTTFGVTDCYHEVAGKTNRFSDVDHACVGLNGKVFFDPDPSNSGLNANETFGLFVILEPWKYVHLRAADSGMFKSEALEDKED